jgi:hypothetical protein
LNVRVLADCKAHVAEVSAIAFFSSPTSSSSCSASPSTSYSSTSVITAGTLREGGGGGVIKVFLVPVANEGGVGGLICVRVFTGISSTAVKLQVMSHARFFLSDE